AVGIGAVF
nr:Chain C, HIV-1 fusion peptide residue 512-519 [Human immunodeficiency virus 1]5TKJ_F Chain F, HIV-1 fusion peptide residue 512-519 [Human immunodeficiency virus 1]5TKJ_I Chain I, HIV-1 fusion peptide residue 512-519 [Human immunodeficiency virus 1]5TKJ_L Chain L, HIV-1 fusion peptide residue 512-519 [Human immunodeficiency virus 1]5TKK_A Chain A, HIV-1 fusion peptide residue 512-519 [Human immunodeficiency virus 1]6CDM_C Chain C, HIV fusion peptide (512-519) [Human immunodeficiency virus 1]